MKSPNLRPVLLCLVSDGQMGAGGVGVRCDSNVWGPPGLHSPDRGWWTWVSPGHLSTGITPTHTQPQTQTHRLKHRHRHRHRQRHTSTHTYTHVRRIVGNVTHLSPGPVGATQSMNVGNDCGTSRPPPPFLGFHCYQN